MTREQMISKLETIINELEGLSGLAEATVTGYASTAIDLGTNSLCLAVDLLHTAELISDRIEKMKAETQATRTGSVQKAVTDFLSNTEENY